MKTIADRQHERRVAKLEDVQRQIRSGALVVRNMTSAERAKYPAQPRAKKPRT